MHETLTMTRAERRTAVILGLVFFLRMLGLFMLIPVLALHTETLAGATPVLIGLAIGVYGLTQALCQIPLGALSDRWGRRPVIVFGLSVFALGALIAALAQSIWPVIVGRAIQGAGAISGATLALATDASRANQRSKMMAIIGVFIGAAFSIAFLAGPWLNGVYGLRGVFLAGAVLAALAIVLVTTSIDTPRVNSPARGAAVFSGLADPALRPLYVGVFTLHGVLAASFVAVPIALEAGLGLAPETHYSVYLPVLLGSFVVVGPMIARSARSHSIRKPLLRAIAAITAAEIGIALGWAHGPGLHVALLVFFVGFNLLEASMPGYVSRLAPVQAKGAALGAYATFQFLGVFAGGLIGGLVVSWLGHRAVPLVCAVSCATWFLMAWLSDPDKLEFDDPLKD